MSSLRAPVDRTHVRWSVLTMLQHDIPEITAVFQQGGFRGLAAWLACGVVDIWDAFPYFSVVSAPSRISRLCRLVVRLSVAHPAARRARMAFCHVAGRAIFFPLDTRMNVPPSNIHARTHTLSHPLLPTTPSRLQMHKYPHAHACTHVCARTRTHTCLLITDKHTHTHSCSLW
jgi:hypothetical protein